METHIFRRVSGAQNAALPKNFHTKKFDEIKVFYAVLTAFIWAFLLATYACLVM